MSTGKVNELDRLAIELQLPNMPFHSNARIIADALPQTGQPIEQRTFSAIGITDNRNAGVRLPASGYVVDSYACFGGFTHCPLHASR